MVVQEIVAMEKNTPRRRKQGAPMTSANRHAAIIPINMLIQGDSFTLRYIMMPA